MTPPLSQLVAIFGLAIYIINLGYACDGAGTPLKDFEFVSRSFTGLDTSGPPGNRFRGTWIGDLPIPLPREYLLGFDSQAKDLDRYNHKSYLRGEWKYGGWWYYYLYGLLVKTPCGTTGLFTLVVMARFLGTATSPPITAELVTLLPAAIVLFVVSVHTEFNIHLRYAFPALGFLAVFLGKAGALLRSTPSAALKVAILSFEAWTLTSLLSVYPHHLAYFNEVAGGAQNGHRHLLGSSVDWGQDHFHLSDWMSRNRYLRPLYVINDTSIPPGLLAESDPSLYEPAQRTVTGNSIGAVNDAAAWLATAPRGCCAVSVNVLCGGEALIREADGTTFIAPAGSLATFLQNNCYEIDKCGYAYRIYRTANTWQDGRPL